MIEQPANEAGSDSTFRFALSPEERAQLRRFLEETPLNGGEIWRQYKFEFLKLPAEHRDFLVNLAGVGERAQCNLIARLSRPYIDQHLAELQQFCAQHKDMSTGYLVHLQSPLIEFESLAPYAHALKAQGKTTAASAFAYTPTAWLPNHGDTLLEIREVFGHLATKIFIRLKEIAPNGWDSTLQSLHEILGIGGLGLLVRQPHGALTCAMRHKETIQQLREICESVGRPDAFIASVTYLSSDLLDTHAGELIALARANPAKLPETLSKLTAEDLDLRLPLVLDAVRNARSSIAATIAALKNVSHAEHDFASRLIIQSGVFADRAILFRGTQLFEQNRVRHEEILSTYGHAYWGLAERFLSNFHDGVREHYDFIEQTRQQTQIGAGHFFSHVPLEYWDSRGLAFAERYRQAAGHIAKDHGARFMDFEEQSTYRTIVDQNRELFNIRWVNRYTDVREGIPQLTLLEQNLRNIHLPPREGQPVALFIAAQTDPLNTFAARRYFQLLSKVGERARLYIAEFSDKYMIGEMIERICCDPRYGGNPQTPRTIDLLMIAAHSDGYSLQASGSRHILPATSAEAESHPDQYLTIDDGDIISSWASRMSKPSSSILFACSAFKEQGDLKPIGRIFQEKIPSTTFHGLTRVGNFQECELDERGMPVAVYWQDGYTWR